jgi:hypothetical protein
LIELRSITTGHNRPGSHVNPGKAGILTLAFAVLVAGAPSSGS